MKHHENFDVVIVGAGAAGLSSALALSPLHTAVLSETTLEGPCSSRWSQGGFAAAAGINDTAQSHARDTLKVADGLADENVVFRLTQDALQAARMLEDLGLAFEKEKNGKYRLNREAGHSEHRILHTKAGDGFGRELMRTLVQAVRRCPSATMFENTCAFELLRDKAGQICGVAATGPEGGLHIIRARAVILATGGIGALYAQTTNPLGNTGRGLALAARAGAVLSDLEFMQFHPTALDIGLDPAPLATEALRGAGAVLINGQGARFVDELAARDIVARAIFRERGKGQKVFLDCRAFVTPEKFPALFENCARAGTDPAREPVPVMPAAHYHMGGIATDLRGRSSLAGLWSCGEAAATGLHGANRLASNSLMEAVVMGGRIGSDIRNVIDQLRPGAVLPVADPPQADSGAAIQKQALRRAMSDHVGVVRDEKNMLKALGFFSQMEKNEGDSTLRDMALVARLVTAMALSRRESRGGHNRLDCPETKRPLQKRRFMTLADIDAVLLSETKKRVYA